MLQVLSRLFRMFEVFSIRSALIHSSKVLKKAIGVKTYAVKLINN